MQIDILGLAEEFGIDKMPEEQRNVVLARILESAQLRVTMRMAETLGDEDMERIAELGKSDNPEALAEIEKLYPSFRQTYQEEIDRIREEMRALMPTKEETAGLKAELQPDDQQPGQ